MLDCFKLPGKSVFSAHRHARNLALKWLNINSYCFWGIHLYHLEIVSSTSSEQFGLVFFTLIFIGDINNSVLIMSSESAKDFDGGALLKDLEI